MGILQTNKNGRHAGKVTLALQDLGYLDIRQVLHKSSIQVVK